MLMLLPVMSADPELFKSIICILQLIKFKMNSVKRFLDAVINFYCTILIYDDHGDI